MINVKKRRKIRSNDQYLDKRKKKRKKIIVMIEQKSSEAKII